MKIVTLLENTVCRPDLAAARGLSLYVETRRRRILFDMGSLGKTEAENRVTIAKKIEYLEKDHIKLPNIAIEVGDGEKKGKEVECITVGKKLRKMYSPIWKTTK